MPITEQKTYPKLAAALGLSNDLYLKREDTHPLGSHKGRSIPTMIKKYLTEGWTDFTISSSGNAALAAVLAVKNSDQPLSLKVFVGEKIDPEKLKLIKEAAGRNQRIEIRQVKNPKREAFLLKQTGNIKNLRQSTDDAALIGYEELAQELAVVKNLQAIFVPTSSGTTAQGLKLDFDKLNLKPQIHIVQTTACHPLVAALYPEIKFPATEKSLATAIVDKVAHREIEVIKAVKDNSGAGWVIDDAEIKEAINLGKKYAGLEISPNSALAIAGLKKAAENGWRWTGNIVCLITGR